MSADVFKKSTVDLKEAKEDSKSTHGNVQKDTSERKMTAKTHDQSNGNGSSKGKGVSQCSPTHPDLCSKYPNKKRVDPIAERSHRRGNVILHAVPVTFISLLALATRFYRLQEPAHIW